MPFQASIIGLSKMGASIGLALAAYPEILTCVGYDEDPHIAKEAVKLAAISKSYLALHRCVQQSRVIFLACPLDELRENLSIIAEHAQAGTLVIDTSPNKTQVSAWAQELLPDNIYFTGWTLALNAEHLLDPELGVEAARRDMFANSKIGINDPPGTPEKALNLSSKLASMLEAEAYFIDSVEADGLIAMGHELPRVAALAVLLATVDAPGWQEARKLAGPDYAKGTLPILSVNEREELGLSMRMNRTNMIRLIDDLVNALARVRGHLAEENAAALEKDIDHAINQRLLWLEQRKKMSWIDSNQVTQPQAKRPSMLGAWMESKLKKGRKS